MSYILDALQKSEQERKQQSLPDVHAKPQHLSTTKRRWWPWILAGSLLLLGMNMAALWYWLAPTAEVVKASPTATTPGRTAAVELPAVVVTKPAPTSNAESPVLSEESTQWITPTDLTDLESLRAITPVRITSLPLNIQQQIPALKFSSHLYSEDFRMVNINGRMMREGDLIYPQLQLIEITEDGVILSFREYHLQMSVLQNWSFD
jgi:general secretion pathway protein B